MVQVSPVLNDCLFSHVDSHFIFTFSTPSPSSVFTKYVLAQWGWSVEVALNFFSLIRLQHRWNEEGVILRVWILKTVTDRIQLFNFHCCISFTVTTATSASVVTEESSKTAIAPELVLFRNCLEFCNFCSISCLICSSALSTFASEQRAESFHSLKVIAARLWLSCDLQSCGLDTH